MVTKIEWVKNQKGTQGYTINPVKGLCPMHCKTPDGYEYCYAAGERGLYKRFKWNPEVRFDKEVPIYGFPTGSKVFIGSTIELFGEWVKPDWLNAIFASVRESPDVTFIFLTKRPENLSKWSPFPPNTNIGVSVTNQEQYDNALKQLEPIKATVKFISFEPLLGGIMPFHPLWFPQSGVNWVIIGQCTPVSAKTAPKIEWIREIVEAADKAGIPVFLKNNLLPLLMDNMGSQEGILNDIFWRDQASHLRQEFPEGV